MEPQLEARGNSTHVRRATAWLLVLLAACYVYFVPSWGDPGDWNQNVRADMALAIVNHSTIRVDPYHWNSGDIAFAFGHYYSIQGPGQSLAGVPVALVFKAADTILGRANDFSHLGEKGTWSRLKEQYYLLEYLSELVTTALPALFLCWLFFWFLGYLTDSLLTRCLLTLSLGLGTSVFPYAQQFYSHVPAAFLLFAGFVGVHVVSRTDAARSVFERRLRTQCGLTILGAGLSLGLACDFEYSASLIAFFICLYALVRLKPMQWPFLLAGLLPGAAIDVWYNLAAFHSPLFTAESHYTTFWPGNANGVSGFTFPPHADAVEGMSVSPYRGLFFLSPFLLLAFPGYVMWGQKGDRLTALLFFAVPVAFFFTICMYVYWHAGSTVGPRFLIPLLPFLALPVAFTVDAAWGSKWWRRLVKLLFALSFANVWIQTLGAGGGYPGEGIRDPLLNYSLPSLALGHVHTNLGSYLLGSLTGAHSIITVVPLLILLEVWSLVALRPLTTATAASARERTPAPAEP